jgi:carnitine O-acetyltransferase
VNFDATGKVSFDHAYDQPDPRVYFNTLGAFGYCIPQLAKPHFQQLIREYRQSQEVLAPNVLDIGCSYGINAALLKCDTTIDELSKRYRDADIGTVNRAAMLARDREFIRTRGIRDHTRYVGLDVSYPALSYGVLAGFMDDAVHADLEENDLTERQREQLSEMDLVISTGCLGYVTNRTINRVLDANGDRRPWMAHFVLRMFPFDPVDEGLAEYGYQTEHVDGVFKQRRFASEDEQSQVLDTLSDVGVDPRGLEADGWLYAQLHISRPRDARRRAVMDLGGRNGTNRGASRGATSEGTTVNDSPEWSTRTFGNEDRLPRVPLPTLAESCERFLTWCAPLLTAEQLAATEAEVAAFQAPDGPGPTLHAALERYNATEGVHSWLDTFWPYRYLGRRDRIALNANFFFLFRDTGQGQLDRAADLIASALNYKLLLDEEKIPPIIQRGQALTMEQNKYLFSTTRIPGAVQDTVRAPYSAEWPGPSQARHIVVFFRGNLLRMDVLGADGRPYALEDLVEGLGTVVKAGAIRVGSDSAVGQLTTKARAEWAASRQALLAADPGNAEALEAVETALFCVCLEDFAPEDIQHASDQLLHGDSGNRWFDKAVSLIVFEDGTAGINVEHCGLDGTTILSFVDGLLGAPAEQQSAASGARFQGPPPVEPVEFILTDDLRADVAKAGAEFADYAADMAFHAMSFADFGANNAKQLRMSPDAFVQLAYQLAHQRSKGLVGATYESIATRQWRRGRTEAMRVITPEILTFVAAMDDPAADLATKRAAFRAAAEKHVQRAKECQSGDAPEQHLWELQLIARRRGAELGVTEPLALYETPGWLIMRDDYLSTSSAPSVNIRSFGFGSTSSTCIGVGYVLLPDRFNLYLSTPRAVADQMRVFADRLREAVYELRDLLAGEIPA